MPHINDKYDFTVSMFVLHPNSPKIALHWHKKLHMWNNYGGHIELEDDPLETIETEMLEETGLSPQDYEILKTHDAPEGIGVKEMPNPFGMHVWKYGDLEHWHVDFPYIIKSRKTILSPQEEKSMKYGWFTIEEIRDLNAKGSLDEGTLKICDWIVGKYF